MSVLRVQKITNEAGTGPVEFTKGVNFPQSQNFTESDMVINAPTGIATVTFLQATNVNVSGTLTATAFVGNGANITNAPGTPSGKIIALHLVS